VQVRKAYIILAHKDEGQLIRLVDRLNDGHSRFFVHIDLKSKMHKNNELFHDNGQVTMLKSTASVWGSFGLVRATLNALSVIKRNGDFDRVILLSGQDYPIRSNAAIDEFFNKSPYSNFLESFELPNHNKWPANGGSYRINKYYLGPLFLAKYSARAINFLSSLMEVFKRKLNLGLKHFHGSQWWMLDMKAVDHILHFVNQNPQFSAFHRYTFAPDEVFFQTILLNTKDVQLKQSISNDNKRFMKWRNSESAHPENLLVTDLEEIKSSNDLFARKFDGHTDSAILDIIDRDCLGYKAIIA
jgi:hypothetical protein